MKFKIFKKNGKEFIRYIERVTGRPFKALTPVEGTTAHQYLSGLRDSSDLFTDPDLIAIVHDEHPDGGLLYVFSDYSSVVYKPSAN